MYYLAKWRISNAGQIILPGTVFEAECSEEEEARLLRLGAIVRTEAPKPEQVNDEAAPDMPPSQTEAGDEGGDSEEADTQEEGDKQPEEAAQSAAEDDEEEGQEDEDEADDEAPVPVIDVSEGVVEALAAQPEAEPAKKKNTGRGKK